MTKIEIDDSQIPESLFVMRHKIDFIPRKYLFLERKNNYFYYGIMQGSSSDMIYLHITQMDSVLTNCHHDIFQTKEEVYEKVISNCEYISKTVNEYKLKGR